MNRDDAPALPAQPSTAPARPNPLRRPGRRLRMLALRMRALAWKAVRVSGKEYLKGFANKAGALTAHILFGLLIAHMLGIDPEAAVRKMLGL